MQITHGTSSATFTPEAGYTSDDASFALWLQSTFPVHGYPSEAARKADLLNHGCTVDGEALPPEPAAEPAAEPVPATATDDAADGPEDIEPARSW